MAIAYYGTTISPHMDVTPEGYLICRDVPINRTGPQDYLAAEMQLDGDPMRMISVDRTPEEVFDPAALASFEGKPVTDGHPPENVSTENFAAYTRGHVQNVRRVGDFTLADLYITDAVLADQVRSGAKREVSCGYTCRYQPDGAGYRQTAIRGNHVAIVPRGRAGRQVAIRDNAPATLAEKGLKHMKKETKAALFRFFGLAAQDAQPEELEQLTQDVVTVTSAPDAEPAATGPSAALDAEPAQALDEETVKAPKGDDLGSKLDRILEMLEAKSRGGRGEHPLHDEDDLDDLVEKLAGKPDKDPEAASTVSDSAAAEMSPEVKDAAVELLRKVRPAVAAIQDKTERSRVVDALLSTIQGPNTVGAIIQAAQDSAQRNAEVSRRTSYEKVCADAEAAYAARNPHNKKQEV